MATREQQTQAPAEDKPDKPSGPPSVVYGMVLIAVCAVLVAIVFIPRIRVSRQADQLRATGTPATATILNVEDTGNRYNRDPEVVLRLRVQPEGGEAYETELTRVMSAVDLQTYRTGAQVKVRFDPADPNKVALVGPVPPPTTAEPAPDADPSQAPAAEPTEPAPDPAEAPQQ